MPYGTRYKTGAIGRTNYRKLAGLSTKTVTTTKIAAKRKPLVTKTVVTKPVKGISYGIRKRRGYVKPRKVITKAGQLSQTLMALSSRPSKQVKELKDVGSANIYLTSDSSLVSGDVGTQAVFSFPLLWRQDLAQIGTRLPTASAGLVGPRRFVLESVLSEQTFTNTTTAPCEMEIIDFACKRDLGTSNSYNVQGTGYAFTNYPESLWEVDAESCGASPTPGGSYASRALGARPFDGQAFLDYYKPLKRSIVMLPQGGSHRHIINLKPNRIIDEVMWNNTAAAPNNASVFNFAGMTIYTMVICKGFPQVLTSGSQTGYSTNSVQIARIRQLRYKYTYVQDIAKSIYYDPNMLRKETVPAKVVNVGSGQVETETQE